ncbi:MAG: LysM peptidoglycan-binding domain-containing protein [Polyangiaceae bacterium]|jgi:hypothetical protein
MKSHAHASHVAHATLLLASGVLFVPTLAFAQAAGPAPTPVPGTTGGATAVPVAGGTAPIPAQGGVQGGGSYGFGNPQSPNGTIGGGNATESSAHPVTGDQEDTFDFGPKHGAGGAVHGDENGPMFLGGSSFGGGETPYSHIVRRGDTLWGISGYYFQNSYQWPRVWSYNPQIKNPNWIYPGDEIRLKSGERAGAGGPAKPALPYQGVGQTLTDRRRQVPHGTVFLRDQGWIRDQTDEVWGDITGARADKMFLSDLDEIYIHIDRGHEVHMGQELTIFRPIHMAAAGTIVQIGGTARIDQWDAQDRVARAKIVESLNVIERGAKVGPLDRTFAVVPPRRNDADVDARVLASLHPNEFFGQNQVIFIDKGEQDGLKIGNRLFVMHRGDSWRQSLVEPHAGDRVSADDETPMPPMEHTPGSRNDAPNYPDEVIAEMRVISVKKGTATCLLTASRSEIEPFDRVVARKGY